METSNSQQQENINKQQQNQVLDNNLEQPLLQQNDNQQYIDKSQKQINNNYSTQHLYESDNSQITSKQGYQTSNEAIDQVNLEKLQQNKQLDTNQTQDTELQLKEDVEKKAEEQKNKQQQAQKTRLVCLDIFRGLTMTGMILVDDSGYDEYGIWPMQHSDWAGWTTADQVFPNFLFIMGLAIPFALKNPQENKKDKKVWYKLFKRGILLFLIGLFLNMQSVIPSVYMAKQKGYEFCFYFRILGILQRTGIAYIVAASLYLTMDKLWKQMIVYGSCIVLYLIFMFGFPVPSYTYGYYIVDPDLGNCRRADQYFDCGNGFGKIDSRACNFQGYLDTRILGQYFNWNEESRPTDPEGFWGYLTSIFNTFMGICTCLILQKYKKDQMELIKRWLILGLGLAFTGTFMAIWYPLNKDLWSVSFMFMTSGISVLCIVGIFYLVDILGKGKEWVQKVSAPFIWLGMNPLFIYVLMMFEQNLLQDNAMIGVDGQTVWSWCVDNIFNSWIGNRTVSSVLNAFVYLTLWICIAGIMYKKKIFVKL